MLGLNEINGMAPAKPWPLTTTTANATIVNRFGDLFWAIFWWIIDHGGFTADHIPAYLEPIFAAKTASTPGWICSSTKAATDVRAYGLRTISQCGTTS